MVDHGDLGAGDCPFLNLRDEVKIAYPGASHGHLVWSQTFGFPVMGCHFLISPTICFCRRLGHRISDNATHYVM